MVPTGWNGSLKIYSSIIRPFVLKHQKEVDKALEKAGDIASDVINEGMIQSDKSTLYINNPTQMVHSS